MISVCRKFTSDTETANSIFVFFSVFQLSFDIFYGAVASFFKPRRKLAGTVLTQISIVCGFLKVQFFHRRYHSSFYQIIPLFKPPSKSKRIYVIFSPICQRILLQSNPWNLHCFHRLQLLLLLLLHHPDCQQM